MLRSRQGAGPGAVGRWGAGAVGPWGGGAVGQPALVTVRRRGEVTSPTFPSAHDLTRRQALRRRDKCPVTVAWVTRASSAPPAPPRAPGNTEIFSHRIYSRPVTLTCWQYPPRRKSHPDPLPDNRKIPSRGADGTTPPLPPYCARTSHGRPPNRPGLRTWVHELPRT